MEKNKKEYINKRTKKVAIVMSLLGLSFIGINSIKKQIEKQYEEDIVYSSEHIEHLLENESYKESLYKPVKNNYDKYDYEPDVENVLPEYVPSYKPEEIKVPEDREELKPTPKYTDYEYYEEELPDYERDTYKTNDIEYDREPTRRKSSKDLPVPKPYEEKKKTIIKKIK